MKANKRSLFQGIPAITIAALLLALGSSAPALAETVASGRSGALRAEAQSTGATAAVRPERTARAAIVDVGLCGRANYVESKPRLRRQGAYG